MPHEDYVDLQGSERHPVPEARDVGPADPDEDVEVSIVLSRRAGRPTPSPTPISRQEFARQHGAREEDIHAVETFAAQNGLQVVRVDVAARTVVLAGSVADMQSAFDVPLRRFEHHGTSYRGRTGTVRLPASLSGIVTAVLGLDDRAQARAHSRIHREVDAGEKVGGLGATAAGAQPFWPTDLATLYDFPDRQGDGQCIGMIELGGGFRRSDLKAYFAELGLPAPEVHSHSVDHARNRPSTPQSADGEVMLDIEVAGAVAPNVKIIVYFAPNTDRGFLDAINAAIHDHTNQPSVVSISWGGPESSWASQALDAFDEAFQDAGALGVSIFCAAGDSGSTDGVGDGKQHTDFPASSPHVVGCGGTRLTISDQQASEVVWSTNGATGGGISDHFDPPDYQAVADVPSSANPPGTRRGRGVPDVAGDADPATGYIVRVDGRMFVIGGTSAVAPLWAGLTALLNQGQDAPVGFLNPALYAIAGSAPDAFHDVTQGSNGAYHAVTGWDPCTGWGSPNAGDLAAALD
ncbi:S8 family serine peptidase [Microlunatus sp. Gsoil 973]|nr:S8 family serine peptidase [Microlunatus sp. Gsoil 973]